MKFNRRGERYHSIQIGDYNTYDDWSLVPTSRPVFQPPKLDSNIVSIPGSAFPLDLTNIFTRYTGTAPYKPVTSNIEFMVTDKKIPWWGLYSVIKNSIHGKRLRVVLLDDPDYYYDSLVEVGEWTSGESRSRITISFTPDPYRVEKEAVQRTVTVNNSASVTLKGSDMPVVPVIAVSAGMSVTFDGTAHSLSAGDNVIDDILLLNGDNVLTFSGSGTAVITYRRGKL